MAEKTDAQKRAQKTYMEKFAVARVRMEHDQYDRVQAHAGARSESVNGFINRAIREAMERDNGVPGPSGGRREGQCRGMSQYEKLLLAVLSGARDKNMLCTNLQTVLDRLGFQCRIKGDYFIYTRDGVEEIINLQPAGNKAKPYQVKQVRNIILKYQLGGAIHEI